MNVPSVTAVQLAAAMELPPEAIDAYVTQGMPPLKGSDEYSPLVCGYWLIGHRENKRGNNDVVEFSVSQKIAYGWLRGAYWVSSEHQTHPPSRAWDLAIYLCMTSSVGIDDKESIEAVHFAMAWIVRWAGSGLELLACLDS